MAPSETVDFMSKFITTHRVPEDARRHFASIGWTSKYLSDPRYKAIPTFSRVLKEDTGEDYFFSRTISSAATIPHMVTLQLADFPTLPDLPKGQLRRTTDHTQATRVPAQPDCLMLLQLGTQGLDGHPGVIHGGVSCAILDETIGLCIMLHTQRLQAANATGPRSSLFTVNLNTTFRAPITTPNAVLVRCWLIGREGRKWLAHGQILDSTGQILVEAEGLWLETKRQEKL